MDLGKFRRSHASKNVSWPTKSVDMDDGSRGIGGKAFENTTKTIGNDPRTLGPSHFKNHEWWPTKTVEKDPRDLGPHVSPVLVCHTCIHRSTTQTTAAVGSTPLTAKALPRRIITSMLFYFYSAKLFVLSMGPILERTKNSRTSHDAVCCKLPLHW